jgi:hypothetical protein
MTGQLEDRELNRWGSRVVLIRAVLVKSWEHKLFSRENVRRVNENSVQYLHRGRPGPQDSQGRGDVDLSKNLADLGSSQWELSGPFPLSPFALDTKTPSGYRSLNTEARGRAASQW